jgi:DNA-binding transcriptional LysR family regulator
MGVDHSTIGRRLAALERTFDAPLVIRAPDGLHLTPLGESLLPQDAAREERRLEAFITRVDGTSCYDTTW